jgi:hypothetical protein
MFGTPAGPGASSGGDSRPDLASGDVRQWQNQANQIADTAQDLRRQLQQSGFNPKDLTPVDEVIRTLRSMTSDKLQQDPRGLQQLSAAALEKLKKVDLDLRKRTDTTSNQLLLSGSEDVPAAYRPLVAEYSKALGKKGAGSKPAPPPAPPKGGGGK